MNAILWVIQSLIAIVFLYSGVNKSIYSRQKLVSKGQTGVEGLSKGMIRFIGISEILGAIGIILPGLIDVFPFLTVVAAICLALVMVPASIIHYKRYEPKNVITNCIIFSMCVFVTYGRLAF
ncbi:DoxX family protein [Arachidicoccus soli]|uniref:DoxX family protein n=1 Tax=Arachidicoccus soli TaxID=2341117 RepID=A0A386HMA3_9BACT|nr:DoxX family protein [Arachidicoccus soli]